MIAVSRVRGKFGVIVNRRHPRSLASSAASGCSVLRALTSVAIACALAGCASLAANGDRFDAADLKVKPTLMVATTRKPVKAARAEPWFGPERAARMSFARASLTPPDGGRFSFASVGLSEWKLNAIETVPQISELFAHATERRDVLVYIHGFNQSFEWSALSAARLADGVSFRGETMVFSWPSKEKLFDYHYDRESAMWSRDALEQVFERLLLSPSVGRIHIVAHSVGTMLTMESLRQLNARHGSLLAGRIGAVVFASPDIDMDVFTSSVERIGPLASKITVVTATNDRALAVSAWIAGGITRVGTAEKARLEQMGLRVVDASQEGWGFINHDLFLTNAQIRQLIRREIEGRGVASSLPPS
jgi:esterase/lipase superfamily enzyme